MKIPLEMAVLQCLVQTDVEVPIYSHSKLKVFEFTALSKILEFRGHFFAASSRGMFQYIRPAPETTWRRRATNPLYLLSLQIQLC
jgi:hypothetical protein